MLSNESASMFSVTFMVVEDRHELGERGSRRRAGRLAGDSSLAVREEVRCEGKRAPWQR